MSDGSRRLRISSEPISTSRNYQQGVRFQQNLEDAYQKTPSNGARKKSNISNTPNYSYSKYAEIPIQTTSSHSLMDVKAELEYQGHLLSKIVRNVSDKQQVRYFYDSMYSYVLSWMPACKHTKL